MQMLIQIFQEGLVVMYGMDMRPQKFNKITTDLCKQRDLWVSDAVPMTNLNKIAFLLSSKEICENSFFKQTFIDSIFHFKFKTGTSNPN